MNPHLSQSQFVGDSWYVSFVKFLVSGWLLYVRSRKLAKMAEQFNLNTVCPHGSRSVNAWMSFVPHLSYGRFDYIALICLSPWFWTNYSTPWKNKVHPFTFEMSTHLHSKGGSDCWFRCCFWRSDWQAGTSRLKGQGARACPLPVSLAENSGFCLEAGASQALGAAGHFLLLHPSAYSSLPPSLCNRWISLSAIRQ